jgi:hypothetical protein
MRCTWVDCEEEASIPRVDREGREWANLCQKHHDMLEGSMQIDGFDPKRLLCYWVRAHGGYKKAAQFM